MSSIHFLLFIGKSSPRNRLIFNHMLHTHTEQSISYQEIDLVQIPDMYLVSPEFNGKIHENKRKLLIGTTFISRSPDFLG